MFDEGILGNRNGFVGLDHADEGLVGEIKVKGIGVVEVVFGDIDLAFVNI